MRQDLGPTPELRHLVESTLGVRSVAWRKPHTGLSAAQRFVISFVDGSSVFVKAAVDEETAEWLRTEQRILSSITGDFLPRSVAWVDDAERPMLVTEDLSGAHWPADSDPVRWDPGQFALLFETLRRIAAVPAPAWLPGAPLRNPPRWQSIEREADAFLAMGLCPESWFREAIGGLIAAEQQVSLAGDCLVHNDVRSDNLCFAGGRLVLVDWSHACRGHPEYDLAAVIATLPLEGGPDPVTIMPHGGGWAGHNSAIASRRAYLDTDAPDWLIAVLKRLAVISLKWASQTLDIPPWIGVEWNEIE